MRSVFLVLTICTVILSCKKDSSENYSFGQCPNAQYLDSASISNKLVGSWVWKKQACFPNKAANADKNVIIAFNANSTFTVTENSVITTAGSWKLEINDINYWALDLTSSSIYLYGAISFCKNQVIFNDSYRDGCDNLFVKQ